MSPAERRAAAAAADNLRPDEGTLAESPALPLPYLQAASSFPDRACSSPSVNPALSAASPPHTPASPHGCTGGRARRPLQGPQPAVPRGRRLCRSGSGALCRSTFSASAGGGQGGELSRPKLRVAAHPAGPHLPQQPGKGPGWGAADTAAERKSMLDVAHCSPAPLCQSFGLGSLRFLSGAEGKRGEVEGLGFGAAVYIPSHHPRLPPPKPHLCSLHSFPPPSEPSFLPPSPPSPSEQSVSARELEGLGFPLQFSLHSLFLGSFTSPHSSSVQIVSVRELEGLGVGAVLDLRQPPVGCKTERRNMRAAVKWVL
ncbi:hypothetical protein ABPG75_000521 [Micractinium tetrahymenae]